MALGGRFDLDSLSESISVNESKMTEPHFWDDQRSAQGLIDETNDLKKKFDDFHKLTTDLDDVNVLLELLMDDPDDEMWTEFEEKLAKLQENLQAYRLAQLLNGQYDKNNAILEIHPGAGGTESQDWGSMLLRMYTRWSEKHHFRGDSRLSTRDDVAGINSVTLLIKGHNAYGYLRSEKGVHCLVRLSPFDSAGGDIPHCVS